MNDLGVDRYRLDAIGIRLGRLKRRKNEYGRFIGFNDRFVGFSNCIGCLPGLDWGVDIFMIPCTSRCQNENQNSCNGPELTGKNKTKPRLNYFYMSHSVCSNLTIFIIALGVNKARRRRYESGPKYLRKHDVREKTPGISLDPMGILGNNTPILYQNGIIYRDYGYMTELNQQAEKTGLKIVSIAIIFSGIAVFAFYASTHMVAAGDTWVALACGRHHVEHGVNTVEPFSFNSHKPGPSDEQLASWPTWTHTIIRRIHPTGWINQNWLTHVLFYELVQWSGSDKNPNYNMLVYWKFGLYLVTAFVVYAIGRVMGAAPLLAATAACFAMIIGRSFYDIRPAGWSNLFVPVFILILALSVYRNIRFIWLLVPLVVLWANFHGGYIYVYLMMVPFCGLHLVSMASKNRLIKMPFKNLLTVIYAAIASFIAMLILNPYHLTNLTHTFEISISKHAESWRTVNEWKPAFDFLDKSSQSPNPVGDEEMFGAMCILFTIALLCWLIGQLVRPRLQFDKKAKPADIEKQYQPWPKIDLPMLAIALMTTYMAVESRRFIAIAGSAVCPMIFLLIHQAWQAFSIRKQYPKTFTLEPQRPGRGLRLIGFSAFSLAVLAAVIPWHLNVKLPGSLGKWIPTASVAWKFKTIYIDPWTEDPTYNSIFMRMTASNVKPIDACKFIRDNKMAGRVFNYWTEGGAIAFGQKPDPNTGEIPLKLFMDGRAQAAYDHSKFRLWQDIYAGAGCPAVQNAYLTGRRLTDSDYKTMANWIEQQLKQYQVWVILQPLGQANSSFMKAMNYSESWKTAYYDPYQWMLVDTSDERGQKLIDDILTDKAAFPNEISKSMTLCKLIPERFSPNLAPKLEEAVVSAFKLRPSPLTISELVQVGQVLRKHVVIFRELTVYLADFKANQKIYQTQQGYGEKLRTAVIAADFLARNLPEKKAEYNSIREQYETEMKSDHAGAIW